MTYDLTSPLMVLAYDNNHEAAVTVPSGKRIDIVGPARDDRFVIVKVDGQEFLVFETDLLQTAAA